MIPLAGNPRESPTFNVAGEANAAENFSCMLSNKTTRGKSGVISTYLTLNKVYDGELGLIGSFSLLSHWKEKDGIKTCTGSSLITAEVAKSILQVIGIVLHVHKRKFDQPSISPSKVECKETLGVFDTFSVRATPG